jgi:hypothetical protein
MLSNLGVTFVEYSQPTEQNKTIKPKSQRQGSFITIIKKGFFQNKDITFKKSKNKTLRFTPKIQTELDPKIQQKIKTVNDVVNDILYTTKISDVVYDNKFYSPSIMLKFYDFSKKEWFIITKQNLRKVASQRFVFIEASNYEQGYKNIYVSNKQEPRIETRYFIMVP